MDNPDDTGGRPAAPAPSLAMSGSSTAPAPPIRPDRRRCRSCLLGGLVLTLAGAGPFAAAHAQTAEDAATACTEAARLIEDEDLDGALDEAKWCVESLEQLRQQRTLSVFPDSVEGFAGGELDNQSAMGMTIMNRGYTGEDGDIDVSLTTGAAGSGLAALAQMGMSLGGTSGKKIRVQKRTVLDMSEMGVEAKYLVQLKSGGMLTIGSSDLPAEDVLAFVRAFPIQALDDALMP